MTLINPINQLITDILAKWSDVGALGTIVVKSLSDYIKTESALTNGLLILERYQYSPTRQYGDNRDERYIVDAELRMESGSTESDWEDTWQELDRVFNDYNDDATTTRYYQIIDFVNTDNNDYYSISLSIQVDVQAVTLPT